jgi:uncharacterized membrane protein YphA (DoxX/SURF4 family)
VNETPSGGQSVAVPVARSVVAVPAAVAVALVVLRLITGFHFYSEGTKKLEYNKGTGETRVAFSAEGFLRGAVGPWAEFYKADLPGFHDWEHLLFVPRLSPVTEKELAERAKWDADYAARQREAIAKKEKPPVEFPPGAPYFQWAQQIDKDWAELVENFKKLDGLSDEQRQSADAALFHRRQQLAAYLEGEENSFADWQHELWRLGDWEAAPGGLEVPFQTARNTEKRGETQATGAGWVASVRAIEDGLTRDLRDTLSEEQAADPKFVAAATNSLTDPKVGKLRTMNAVVTGVVIGVGVCLMLGLFTRLAAIAGIAFLLMVMAAQPPWVAGARTEFFWYQLVEIGALGTLLASGAGRWAGLDFFLRALCCKRCAAPQRISS